MPVTRISSKQFPSELKWLAMELSSPFFGATQAFTETIF